VARPPVVVAPVLATLVIRAEKRPDDQRSQHRETGQGADSPVRPVPPLYWGMALQRQQWDYDSCCHQS